MGFSPSHLKQETAKDMKYFSDTRQQAAENHDGRKKENEGRKLYFPSSLPGAAGVPRLQQEGR